MSIVADRHLVLVGMMGSGKTTAGRLLAQRLQRPFLDSDAMIEEAQGRTVREIFATDGEDTFRVIETQVLQTALASREWAVIAAAGGVVLRSENRVALRAAGARVVWLRADPAVLAERVKGGPHRPLLDADPEGTLQRMYADRADLYREVADAIVTVDNRTVTDVVEAVLR
ncbi:MAG TPA: shikimate kinase [Ilumatobacteraceae bacterium]